VIAVAAARKDVRRQRNDLSRAVTAIARLDLSPAVFKTCPWQPRELIETGLRHGSAAARRRCEMSS
jgi:hypothetical protein